MARLAQHHTNDQLSKTWERLKKTPTLPLTMACCNISQIRPELDYLYFALISVIRQIELSSYPCYHVADEWHSLCAAFGCIYQNIFKYELLNQPVTPLGNQFKILRLNHQLFKP